MKEFSLRCDLTSRRATRPDEGRALTSAVERGPVKDMQDQVSAATAAREGYDDRGLPTGRDRRIGAPAGSRRFLGALVRPLQAAWRRFLKRRCRRAKGKVKLVKMNIDEHPQIPGQLGIQSIPAVIAFQRGQPVDGFMGAVPESQVKAFIERLVGPLGPSSLETLLAQADEAAKKGDIGGAAEAYAAALAQDAGNSARSAVSRACRSRAARSRRRSAFSPWRRRTRRMIRRSRPRARRWSLPSRRRMPGTSRGSRRRSRQIHSIIRPALISPPRSMPKGRREEAIDQLIAIIKRDRAWNDDGARKQLLQFFEAWGPMDEMTKLGRRKLSSVLFS